MLATVRVVSADDYQRWYDEQAARIKTAETEQAAQRKKYEQPNTPDAAEGEDTGDRGLTGNSPEG
jgi:heme/copper-type cytochrome/quinol oxidase subunit 2